MGGDRVTVKSGDARGPGEESLRPEGGSEKKGGAARPAGPGTWGPGEESRRAAGSSESRGTYGPGEESLRAAIRAHARRRQAREGAVPGRGKPRTDDPKPYDDVWGWYIELRLDRMEAQIKWLLALAAGALVAEVIRVALAALGLP